MSRTPAPGDAVTARVSGKVKGGTVTEIYPDGSITGDFPYLKDVHVAAEDWCFSDEYRQRDYKVEKMEEKRQRGVQG